MGKKKLKFKELTEKQIKKFGTIYMSDELGWGDKIGKLHKMTGLEERTIRKWAKKLGFTKREEKLPEEYEEAKNRVLDSGTKRFLVTWAQNNTEVHEEMIENMEAYADFHGAEIITILGRYRNPTTVEEADNKPRVTWSPRIKPYWSSARHDIHEYLSIMSDVRIQPTAVNPMSGMYSLSGENSCIWGHPKVQLEMIPILDGYKPKMMMTTGACTHLNYSDSKAGKKGEFHHTYGFIMVEIQDDEIFHTRQVTVNDEDGSFYDLFYHVKGGEVTENPEIQGIILGDLHYGEHDEQVIEQTMDLLEKLEPETVVLHDVFDAKSISHHTMKDPFVQYGMEVRGENDLEKEIEGMMEGLELFEDFSNVVIVRANHDVHLDKFLQNDWRKLPTPKNNMKYMEYAHMLLQQHADGEVIGVIPELINDRFPEYITLKYNDSYKIGDWEVGNHGDIGANGSRGSIQQFRKLNTKMVTAHTHQPSRKDGSVCVGTTTKLRLSYNLGPSSWLNSHAIIHPDNRLQQIHFIGSNKDYTTFDV